MSFKQWIRDRFGPEARAWRAASRGKTHRPTQRGFVSRVESLEDRRMLAVLTVNSLLDGSLASLADDGKLQLREAIQIAVNSGTTIEGISTESWDTEHTIRFASSLGGQTIKLNTFINELTTPLGEETMPGPSAFVVRHGVSLTIDGETGLNQGITIARDSTASPFRLFFVDSTAQLTLKSLTLSGGHAKGFNGASGGGAGGGGAAGMGGAIFNKGILELRNSTVTGNTAQGGNGAAGGTINGGGGGGGLGRAGSAGEIIPDSQPGSNDGFYGRGGDAGGPNGGKGGTSPFGDSQHGTSGGFGGGGGGGYGFGGFTTAFIPFSGAGGHGGFGAGGGGGGSGNIGISGDPGGNGGFGGGGGGGGNEAYGGAAGGFGGGSGLNNNGGGGAGMGGAIFNYLGSVTITNSTLQGNNAFAGAAGNNQATVNAQGLGGVVFNLSGTVSVSSSTLAENFAANGGGGIFSVDNGAGSPLAALFLNNNIIADSYFSLVPALVSPSDVTIFSRGGAVKVAGGFNLIGAIVLPATGDVTNTMSDNLTGDPKLGPLEYHGGRTQTMALLDGSPAIDASNSNTSGTGILAPFTDQRGFGRVGWGDIGAFEFGAKGEQSIDFDALVDKVYGDTDFELSAEATSSIPVTFTVTGPASVYQDLGGKWHVQILGAGSVTITAHQAGDDNYFAAPDIEQSFTINKANATIVVTPYDVIFDGLPHTAIVTSIIGVNGETGETVGTVDVSATTHTIAGTYVNDYWTFTGSENYNDIGITSITNNIALALSELQNWTVNRPYLPDVTAAGSPTPHTFTLIDGTLPTGLTLNADGTFSGSPTVIGDFTFTIQASDGAIATGERTYTVGIKPTPVIGAISRIQWTKGHVGYNGSMALGRGIGGFQIVGKPTGLPPGLTAVISGNKITFTGKPTTVGTFAGRITIEDAAGAQASRSFTIKINPTLSFTRLKLTGYYAGKSYSQSINTAGGTGTRTVSYTLSAPLPKGLKISPPSPATGAITISGKTNVKTKITITMTVTDSVGAQLTKTYTLKWVQVSL